MAHWMCTTCGYFLQSEAPPNRCPGCEKTCAFSDVTCNRPECGGEQNIDPLAVENTLKILKGGLKPTAQPKPASPSSKAIPLVEILMGRNINAKEGLDQLSFWAISQVEILKGLSKEQRQQIRSLGRIERYDTDVTIFTEGKEARKFYLVEEGRVAVESQVAMGMHFPISIVYPSQAFGWSALVPPFVYTASVTTLSKTRVLAIDQGSLLAMMQSDPSVGFIIMQNVACIVASRLRTLELELASLFQDR
jgi:CRP/FNR family transcriptional regulator, cyclic AMP receptor protein